MRGSVTAPLSLCLAVVTGCGGSAISASETTANDEGKRYDEMCGQTATVRPYEPSESIPTDALPGAPHAGHWFHEQLLMLVENATPSL